MKSKKQRKKRLIIILIVTIVVGVILFEEVLYSNSVIKESISLLLQYAEIVCVVFTILFSIQEILGSKEIARATFIMELNKNYVENDSYMEIYNYLQTQLDNNQYDDETDDSPIKKSEISNYLTFFETLYILYKREVISFDIIDDLFAYRFFLAVHSKLFQKLKLRPQPENFRNIFKLEKEWLEYRDSIGKIPQKGADGKYDVYGRNKLEDLVNDKKYQELTEDKDDKKRS